MFMIVATQHFLRRARKFLKKHPELRERVAQIIDDLKQDPFAPHLAYHRLGGKLKGVQVISITDSYRITLTVIISDQEVILLDVGSHDEVYR
ncbi:MAG: plasmid stabilization protein [Deltaproteobacteria bacterium CG_4_10_14_3_um_filter_60_8]|nr:MAG: plasmid stabilization protein [Desulfobacterales bacterium CG2_30_60_27]PIY22545.1 MAG: plasmid stabilization protein [Deltaproteobacteria bacterium CG_4_10_14_3_um_filter_60_8]